jgi:hypothetical protein
MTDDNQLIIPDSFTALYLAPGRTKPTASRADIAARYEACEDLATALSEQARTVHWSQGVAEDEVLARIHRGLLEPGAGVGAAEAEWVVRRLAELLEWHGAFPDTGAPARTGGGG